MLFQEMFKNVYPCLLAITLIIRSHLKTKIDKKTSSNLNCKLSELMYQETLILFLNSSEQFLLSLLPHRNFGNNKSLSSR